MKTINQFFLLVCCIGFVANSQGQDSLATAHDAEALLQKRHAILKNYEAVVTQAENALHDLRKDDSVKVLFEEYYHGYRLINQMHGLAKAINQGKFTDYQGLNDLIKTAQYNVGAAWINAENLKRYLPNIELVFKEYSKKILPVAREAAVKLSFSQYLIKIHRKREKELEIEYQIKWVNLVSFYDAIRTLYVIKKTVRPMLQSGVVENEFERVRKSRISRPAMKVYKRYIKQIKNTPLYRDKLTYIKKTYAFVSKLRDFYYAKNTRLFGKILKRVKDVNNIESLMMQYDTE